jgi:hypothetical protein
VKEAIKNDSELKRCDASKVHLKSQNLPLVVRENAQLTVSSGSQGVCHELDLRKRHAHVQ